MVDFVIFIEKISLCGVVHLRERVSSASHYGIARKACGVAAQSAAGFEV